MDRYRQSTPGDDTLDVYGDFVFTRLDMLADPATLPAGVVQISENQRFDTGGATVRGGIARQFQAGASPGTLLFAGIYKPVGDLDQFALITTNALYLFDGATQGLVRYAFPSGERIGAGDTVDVIQAGIGVSSSLPRLFILRGLDQTVLEFDGVSVAVNALIPKSNFGLAYQNRLAVNNTLQSLKTSNFLNFDVWNLLNQFQIEQGGADYLVGLLAWQGDYVLIGSRKKWFVAYFDPGLGTVTPYTGALANTSFLRLLTNEAGPIGKEAMLESAGLVWFVSDTGIFAFVPKLDKELTPLGRPLSADLQPIFSRLSTSYASRVAIVRYGYRLYFSLPISDVPIVITSVTTSSSLSLGVDLPFDLPVNLAAGGFATITTETEHNAEVDGVVQIRGLATGNVNGTHTVIAVLDAFSYMVTIDEPGTVVLGTRATSQTLATRNNTIAVLNLNNRDQDHPAGMWESVDLLPAGFYADWLRVADAGSQRRLWIVDAVKGPALYEEGQVDEVGDVIGGVDLPFDLPVDLSEANFASVPVTGRLVSRAYRWDGAGRGSVAYGRPVRSTECRLTLATGDAGTVTTRLRTPNKPLIERTKDFAFANLADVPVLTRPFARALEVELEVATAAGAPVLRALEVQVRKVGEY